MNRTTKTAALGRSLLAGPYLLWMTGFILIPLCLILWYGLTDRDGALTLANVLAIADPEHAKALWLSLGLSLVSTLICLVMAYPLAMILSNMKFNANSFIVMIFIMPMWINFVLRTAATRDLLTAIGIKGGNMPYLAVMIGMVYNYLPFVILPLYSTMLKMDKSVIEASSDLGAKPYQTFIKTIIPMSMPGIISAATMVFMPTMSSFVISDILGERKIQLLGNLIDLNFNHSLWNNGSTIALIMLVIIGISMLFTRNVKKEGHTRGGLW